MSFKTQFFSFFLITLLISSPAFADGNEGGLVLISTTTGGLSTTGGAIGGGITTTNLTRQAPAQRVVSFLKQNKSDFRAALQLGSGAVIDDFSRLLGFEKEDTKTFARLLRKNRKFVNKNAINDLSVKNVEMLLTWINQEMG